MRKPAGMFRTLLYLSLVLTLSIGLVACGGGGSSSSPVPTGTGSAMIQGQVSGPVFVAVDNDTNLEVAR